MLMEIWYHEISVNVFSHEINVRFITTNFSLAYAAWDLRDIAIGQNPKIDNLL